MEAEDSVHDMASFENPPVAKQIRDGRKYAQGRLEVNG